MTNSEDASTEGHVRSPNRKRTKPIEYRAESVTTDANDGVEFRDGNDKTIVGIPTRVLPFVSIYCRAPSSKISVDFDEATPISPGASDFRNMATTEVAADTEGWIFRGRIEGSHLRIRCDAEGADFFVILRPASGDFSDFLVRALGVQSTSSWANVLAVDLGEVRSIREIRPYLLNTSANGNDTDWRLPVGLESTLGASDVPTGSLGNGFENRAAGTISSGGDGPGISSDGYDVLHHLAALQIQQVGGQETLDVEMRGVMI